MFFIKYTKNNNNQMQVNVCPKLAFFLKKYDKQLTQKFKETAISEVRAKILSQDQIQTSANLIRNGSLVAFPTQTVYGLGANAFDQAALLSIYKTKKRPLSDPIIVHVLDAKQALQLVHVTSLQKDLFTVLTDKFWPGPLTIILKANLDMLPLTVTAQTGFVGVRAPKHPYARRLLLASNVPIGAPSANLFGHVSPTQPVHVFNDFFGEQISIVDGARCEYGVESTVLKILDNQIHVLREGSFLTANIIDFIHNRMGKGTVQILVKHKTVAKEVNMEAPGQMLKHYAPYLPCCLTTQVNFKQCSIGMMGEEGEKIVMKINQMAVISFCSIAKQMQQLMKYYFEVGKCFNQQEQKQQQEDIFCSKEEKNKMREIYFLLRQCQNLTVEGILIVWSGQKKGTIWDKIFRSTQGQQATFIQ